MLIPIGSTRPHWRAPYVTYSLLVANLLVTLLVWHSPNPTKALFVPMFPSLEGWVLSLFAHADLMHFLGNALFLWLFGTIAEDVLGPGLFLLFYLGGNVGATALQYWVTATYTPMALDTPVLGASGAIAGIMGLSACCFMQAKVKVWYLFFLGFRFATGVFEVGMPVFGGLWVGWEIVKGLVTTSLASTSGMEGGVAHWAHVGGFALGLGGALLLRLPKRISREDLVSTRSAPGTEYEAFRDAGQLERMLKESPEDARAWRAYGQALELSGREEQAREAYAKAVTLSLKQGELDNAAEAYQEMCGTEPLEGASSDTLMRIAIALQDKAKPKEAYLTLRHLARTHPRALNADAALMRAAEIARTSLHNPQIAAECYQQLLDTCPISPMRTVCEERLRELAAPVAV